MPVRRVRHCVTNRFEEALMVQQRTAATQLSRLRRQLRSSSGGLGRRASSAMATAAAESRVGSVSAPPRRRQK